MAEQLEPHQPLWQIWQQLPLHPQPAALESLTSYITRVAQANGLQTTAELVTQAFGTGYTWQSLRSFPDGSATSILGLTTLTGCTRTDLEATTLLPLGRHFGRANSTRTLRSLLQGSLASHLRYCPECLAEHDFPYYRLHWRFLILSGCLTHHCKLLDYCRHCDAPIPHLPHLPQTAVCPTCRRDLRTSQPFPLSEDEEHMLSRRTSDLLFLLCSPAQSQEGDPRATLGKRYSFKRQQRGLSLQEVASLTGLNPQILSEIEYTSVSKKATFLDYIQYADMIGIALEEVLSISVPPVSLDEDALLARVDETIQEWMGQKQSTKLAFSKQTGVSNKLLRKYPRINSRLLACHLQQSFISAQKNQQREEELVQLVLNAIKQLEALKKPITQQRIAKLVGMTPHGLRFYPRVEALLIQVTSKHHSSKSQSYLVSVPRSNSWPNE
jgi:hypothetical protein